MEMNEWGCVPVKLDGSRWHLVHGFGWPAPTLEEDFYEHIKEALQRFNCSVVSNKILGVISISIRKGMVE